METPLNQISDQAILDLIDDPSTVEKGFRLLLNKYQERLYWQIRRLVYDHEDANDVVQNCFLKVYKAIGSFKRESKLYTWLYRIATNEAITFLKKKSRKAMRSLDEEGMNMENKILADPFFDGNRTQARLIQAFNELPEKQRVVFNLRYFEEMSYKEMSEILDTSTGALKASYHHAVKKIELFFKKIEI